MLLASSESGFSGRGCSFQQSLHRLPSFYLKHRAIFDCVLNAYSFISFSVASSSSYDFLCVPSRNRLKLHSFCIRVNFRPRAASISIFTLPTFLNGFIQIILQAHFFNLRDIPSSPFLSLRIPVTRRKWQNLNALSEPHPPPPVLQYLHFTHCFVFIACSNPVCIRMSRNTVAF